MAFPGNWKRHGRIHSGPGPCILVLIVVPPTGWVLRGVRTQNPHWRSGRLKQNAIGWWSWGDRQTRVEHATRAALGIGSCRHHAVACTATHPHPRIHECHHHTTRTFPISRSKYLLFSFPSPCIPPLAIGPLLTPSTHSDGLFAQSFIRAWPPCTGPIFSSAWPSTGKGAFNGTRPAQTSSISTHGPRSKVRSWRVSS